MKAESVFDFYVSGETIIGSSVTIYSVADGNLETTKVSEDEFMSSDSN